MMNNNDVSFVKGGLVAIYNPTESVRLDVRVNNDTVWLTQNQMGILFGVDRTVIVRHIGNIYKSGELSEESTCAKIAQVQNEGGRSVRRIQKYHDLDVILSVGFKNGHLGKEGITGGRKNGPFRERQSASYGRHLLRWTDI